MIKIINIKFKITWLSKARLDLLINEVRKFDAVLNVGSLPKRIKKFCVIRSPHVNKSSREQFEQRTSNIFKSLSFGRLEDLDVFLNQQCFGNIKYY